MGALEPASEWLGLSSLSPLGRSWARGGQKDFSGLMVGNRRWARLAGFEPTRAFDMVSFLLPGETELGNAGEQPNKG
jgi:hypothetical protein